MLHDHIGSLLKQAGIDNGSFSVEPFKRIGNNRTYIVNAGDKKYFAKHFFQNRDDLRDRFSAELSFATFAHIAAPGFTPQVLAADPSSRLLLYEFVTGTPFTTDSVTLWSVEQAALFFRELNSQKLTDNAAQLPVASEACFSIDAHIALIANRINQLAGITPLTDEDEDALALISRMKDIWEQQMDDMRNACKTHDIDSSAELEKEQRIISPSDFGFHNALVCETGEIAFLDFEYSGWDDPAKMMGDFFGQLQVPVPQEFFQTFFNLALTDLTEIEKIRQRAEILRPAFRIKWVCIALNVFLPVHLSRRKFADPMLNEIALKKNQLAKAANIIEKFKQA